MKKVSWLGCASALGMLCGCNGEAASGETPQVAQTAQAVVAHAETAALSCADHADDALLDTLEVREQAARPLTWRSKKPKSAPTVSAKILGFNDFHGQLSEGRRVANRPVGGAAVLASYLKAAQVGF